MLILMCLYRHSILLQLDHLYATSTLKLFIKTLIHASAKLADAYLAFMCLNKELITETFIKLLIKLENMKHTCQQQLVQQTNISTSM